MKTDSKTQTTKTVVIAKKKINAAEKSKSVQTEEILTAREMPAPSKKLVLKKTSVQNTDETELPKSEKTATTDEKTESEIEFIASEKKSGLKKSIKFVILAICAGGICGLLLAMGTSRNSSAKKNIAPETDITPTESVTEAVTTEPPTEPTTEEPTIPAMVIDPDKPMIALTYDDGPAVGSSEKIVEVLKEYNAHATFFLVGDNITEETGKIIQEEFQAGCEIGNHTQSHQNLEVLDVDSGMLQLKNCDDRIYKYINQKATLVRPPYGAYDDEIREADKRVFVYWSLESSDWKWDNADKIYEVVMENISDGDIVLMHDIHEETAKASEKLIPDLIDMGYQLVTVSELMQYRNFQAEDGMVLYNVHPDTPLYSSLHGTEVIPEMSYDEEEIENETDDNTE
ncbi:MAG: polysaccharide deacetylase family protein [Oscillospiraceae bacterium]|nr:polysaccharide deacetylase family protein [Oscillospiraceae bacterium]